MKRFCLLACLAALLIPGIVRAQDAATQERLDKLSGQIEDLLAAQRAQQKQIEALAKEIENVREQAAKPTGNYASAEDLKALRESLREVDRKRVEDSEKVSKLLDKLSKTVATSAPPPRRRDPAPAEPEKPAKDEKGYSYVVQSGDTLSVIVQAYREKNIKITTDQILKANPGLKAEKLKVGQKIWIPAPQT